MYRVLLVDANANGTVEPAEWRVRNQQVVIARAGVPQQVLLRGLRYSALFEKWVRVTITPVGIKNYNGTGLQQGPGGETSDLFIKPLGNGPSCPPAAAPQCAPGTELMTGRGQDGCTVYACRPTSAPSGAPAPAESKGAGPSSAIQSNGFLGLLLKALGR